MSLLSSLGGGKIISSNHTLRIILSIIEMYSIAILLLFKLEASYSAGLCVREGMCVTKFASARFSLPPKKTLLGPIGCDSGFSVRHWGGTGGEEQDGGPGRDLPP